MFWKLACWHTLTYFARSLGFWHTLSLHQWDMGIAEEAILRTTFICICTAEDGKHRAASK